MNVPNILSIIRILLTPLFVICLLRGVLTPALLVFTAAGITDALDGLYARWFNQKTVLGAYLDPIADKLLLMSAFITLAALKIIPPWLAVVVISRDIVIVMGYAVFEITDMRSKIEVKPSIISKLTTFAQVLTVFFVLLDPDISKALAIQKFLYWFTALVTITSGLHYIYIGMNIFQNGGSEN
ncbi:CDP-alcohol phosphatidyltransferase family protein [Desulfobacterales bacterium HSG2]|nr:CDP-alcohol phosphatidyltransferase family protein [Desulfobacterales bacterium HSG2]